MARVIASGPPVNGPLILTKQQGPRFLFTKKDKMSQVRPIGLNPFVGMMTTPGKLDATTIAVGELLVPERQLLVLPGNRTNAMSNKSVSSSEVTGLKLDTTSYDFTLLGINPEPLKVSNYVYNGTAHRGFAVMVRGLASLVNRSTSAIPPCSPVFVVRAPLETEPNGAKLLHMQEGDGLVSRRMTIVYASPLLFSTEPAIMFQNFFSTPAARKKFEDTLGDIGLTIVPLLGVLGSIIHCRPTDTLAEHTNRVAEVCNMLGQTLQAAGVVFDNPFPAYAWGFKPSNASANTESLKALCAEVSILSDLEASMDTTNHGKLKDFLRVVWGIYETIVSQRVAGFSLNQSVPTSNAVVQIH